MKKKYLSVFAAAAAVICLVTAAFAGARPDADRGIVSYEEDVSGSCSRLIEMEDNVVSGSEIQRDVCRDHIGSSLGMSYTMDTVRQAVKAEMVGAATPAPSGLQAITFKDMSEADIIAKVNSLFTADQKSSGILASVSLAQFILESGYGKSELAQNANNCFGMKEALSGNTWSGSTWDGSSVYTKKTQEYENDRYVTVTADFRKYSSVEKSIADHSAYLLGAKNGDKLRYDGLKGCTDYKKAVQLIKDGGYATSPTYVENICNVIERWNLTQYDLPVPFLVRVSISNLNIRKGVGTNYATIGKYTGKGVFTIMEVKVGKGSTAGWGRLKSGAGWISLDYATKI